MAKLKILIRGIRNNSHSSAVVNQFQLLEFAKLREAFTFYHEDFPNPWGEQGLGFSPADRALIESYPPPAAGEPLDVIYSLGGPRPSVHARGQERSFLYMVTEFGQLTAEVADQIHDHLRQGGYLITPSQWSRIRFAERLAIPAEEIVMVPHGVSRRHYFPLSPGTIANNRAHLGVAPEEFLFLNFGAMTWNKGVDLLVRAFEVVVGRYPQARLLLKDSSHIYGLKAESLIQELVGAHQLRPETLQKIQVYAGHLDLTAMLCLYNAADCYLSPYRAEGFNLPVLEAIACQTPVVVTAGGPTDDFVNPEVAGLVASSPVASAIGHHLEPEFESLVAEMCRALEAPRKFDAPFRQAADRIAVAYGWEPIVNRLLDLFIAQERTVSHP